MVRRATMGPRYASANSNPAFGDLNARRAARWEISIDSACGARSEATTLAPRLAAATAKLPLPAATSRILHAGGDATRLGQLARRQLRDACDLAVVAERPHELLDLLEGFHGGAGAVHGLCSSSQSLVNGMWDRTGVTVQIARLGRLGRWRTGPSTPVP